jgi:ketosteroid isomerase-like protein
MPEPHEIAARYFSTWKARDFEAFRALLADDVTFRGALGTADGADACAKGIEGMSRIVTDIEILHVFVDGDDVLTVFDLHTSVAPPTTTANWSHVENGKIDRIRAIFDPRELVKG